MLTKVTISGVDDAIDPEILLDIHREFPFVEFAILLSGSRTKVPRYPSWPWILHCMETVARSYPGNQGPHLKLAAHLCGGFSRAVQRGNPMLLTMLNATGVFDRVQINGFHFDPDVRFKHPGGLWCVIFQCPTADDLLRALQISQNNGLRNNFATLYDPSAGEGLRPKEWPTRPLHSYLSLGFAGGIGPDNVETTLDVIGPRDHDYWIDMESGVRTDDKLDLAKVRTVLERAAPYVKRR